VQVRRGIDCARGARADRAHGVVVDRASEQRRSVTEPTASRASETAPFSTRRKQAAEASAKSPYRGANSTRAEPSPGRGRGHMVATTISSSASAVVKWPTKKSAAGIVRSVVITLPPSATRASGSSAAASACAIEPPIVPLLRVAK